MKTTRTAPVPLFDALDQEIAAARTRARAESVQTLAEKLAAQGVTKGLERLRSRLRMRTFELQDAGLC